MVWNTLLSGAPIQVCPFREPTQPRRGWPHHRGLLPLLFSNGGFGSFMSHKNQILSEIAVRRDLRFFFLIQED